MALRVSQLRGRDMRFIMIIAANLCAMAGNLTANLGAIQGHACGWRRIDWKTLYERLETGDLVQKRLNGINRLQRKQAKRGYLQQL
jgi:hypothetical protein